jgi:hypothetical protein
MIPATAGEAYAQLVTHWPGACRKWNAELIQTNWGRFSRLSQDCKRELWAAIKSKGGV